MTANYSFAGMPGYMSTTATQCITPPATPAAATGPPRIVYFITRSNGLPVPLIPADELPFSMKLQSVPRVLTPDQTYGLHYVGNAPYTGGTFKPETTFTSPPSMVRSNSQPPNDVSQTRNQGINGVKPYFAPDALARHAIANNTSFSSSPPTTKRPFSLAETSKSWRRTDEGETSPQSIIDAILRTEAGAETADRLGYNRARTTPPPSGVLPDQDKKEYCTYWILHGDCAYVQQGCRYKHEMPEKSKLAEIGINHVPRWWLERNAAVKLGFGGFGEREKVVSIVGPLKKPEEWLGERKGSASSESSESIGSGSVTSEEKETPQTPKLVEKKIEAKKEIKSPIIPPTRPPTPTATKDETRRFSSTGSDLINFAPLTPTPAATPTPTPPKAILKKQPEISLPAKLPITPATTFSPIPKPILKNPLPAKVVTRVFVPAGESAEKHIAEAAAKKSSSRKRVPRTPSPTRTEKKDVVGEDKSTTGGMAASRWASASAKTATKRTKSGCRPRRPASSSPAGKKVVEEVEQK